MKFFYFILFTLLSLSLSKPGSIIIIGATGNLAKKYLWPALLANIINGKINPEAVNIYGAATQDEKKGYGSIYGIIVSIPCGENPAVCDEAKSKLLGSLEYVKLVEEEHYSALNERLSSHEESYRIYYLSISPAFYEKSASLINKYGRGNRDRKIDLRVVFEKPFGSDFNSALELSNKLSQQFDESEIYRVDHYLGKLGMLGIAEFRRINQNILDELKLPPSLHQSSEDNDNTVITTDIDGVINDSAKFRSHSHTNALVVLAETEDTKGRSGYYNSYGVFRDVMQNHMTQALLYAIMDYGSDISGVAGIYGPLSERVSLLEKLTKLSFDFHDNADSACSDHIWKGTYDDFHGHVLDDLKDSTPHIETVATAAAVRLFNSSKSCKTCKNSGLNIEFRAGKALSYREMYVSISNTKLDDDTADDVCKITYYIQGSKSGLPLIILSGNCWFDSLNDQKIFVPLGWRVATHDWIKEDIPGNYDYACDRDILKNIVSDEGDFSSTYNHLHTLHGSCVFIPKFFSSGSLSEVTNSYVTVIAALLQKDRSFFVQTEELLAQWKLWDSMVSDKCHLATNTHEKYASGFDIHTVVI